MLRHLLPAVPDDPFYQPRKPLWIARELIEAPRLDRLRVGPSEAHYALLINPFYPKDPHASFGKHVLTPTLALTSVAAATPSSWRLAYWDENLLQGPPPVDPLPQVVGITVHLTFARRAYELAGWFRSQGCRVILGGLHVLSCPDEAAPHADALAMGDGVQLWPLILQDVERNALKPRYHAGFERSYNADPAPRRSLLPKRSFLTTTSLIATRGCHNRCGFCYLSTKGLSMPYRVRSAADIRRQWEQDNEPYAVFIDNNLGSKPDYLRELCHELRPLRRIWSAAVSLDVTNHPEVIREMAMAGCTGVFIGFESLADENIAAAGKRSPRAADYAARVRLLHDHGIQVNASFVLGFDQDGKDTFARLAEWLESNRIECGTFHILTPYPGTPLFRQMQAEGRLLHTNWDLYDTAHVVFRPKHMSPEELQLGYDWLYRWLYSPRSIWRRRPADAAAVLPYLAMSYLYKRSNRFWHLLIKHRLVHTAWKPLVHWTRWRHVRFRERLAANAHAPASSVPMAGSVVSASV